MAATVPEPFPNVVGGRLAYARAEASFVRENPARIEEVVARFPEATAQDLETTVEAARRAQPAWGEASSLARAGVLRRAADLIGGRAEEIAWNLTREEGKTLAESRAEVRTGAAMLRYMAQLAELPSGEVVPSARTGVFVYTTREPHGLVALLTPWNFPFSIPCFKLGAALAAGNAAILKPSPCTPLAAWRVVEALVEAGLPEGLLGFLTDSGGRIGKALVAHPAVGAISFTGSTATGRAIAGGAAGRLVPVQLEMGGKNALVVLDDADLDVAAAAIVTAAFSGTGQKCTSTGRLVVDDAVARPLLERVLARAAEVRVGPGLDDRTTMGPLVSRSRLDAVLRAVSEAERAGARVVTGGTRLAGREHASGYFLGPTVLADVAPDSQAARSEIFGPVLPVLTVQGEDEALRLANSSTFGLVAGVCTRSPRRAFAFARGLHAGIVKINESTTGVEHQVPGAGWGESGYGPPELGPTALHFFSRLKSVYWNHASV